jgi:hypothetical protein
MTSSQSEDNAGMTTNVETNTTALQKGISATRRSTLESNALVMELAQVITAVQHQTHAKKRNLLELLVKEMTALVLPDTALYDHLHASQ